ncbi:hypothetical protein T492DRAFT_1093066, partial [Pavlovales sp. CCMP2436]
MASLAVGTAGEPDAALLRRLEEMGEEVARLQTVAHGLTLQLVLHGLQPEVPTDREFTARIYEQVLAALRRGDAELPVTLPDRQVAPAPAERRRAAAEQQQLSLSPSSLPPILPSGQRAAGSPHNSLSPRNSASEHLPSRSPLVHAHTPSASEGLSSSWSASPHSSPALEQLGLRPRPSEVVGYDPSSRLGRGSAHAQSASALERAAGVPRVLRQGGGSSSVRKPQLRNLQPLGTTERSAMGG